MVCSGAGDCVCGVCVCRDYGLNFGPFCDECIVSPQSGNKLTRLCLKYSIGELHVIKKPTHDSEVTDTVALEVSPQGQVSRIESSVLRVSCQSSGSGISPQVVVVRVKSHVSVLKVSCGAVRTLTTPIKI